MDIAGTKKKIQRAQKVAEMSYKKMNELLERVQGMENDLEKTSHKVDVIDYEMAEQRALLEAIASQQGLDVEDVLENADLPDPPTAEPEEQQEPDDTEPQEATSRPSATNDS